MTWVEKLTPKDTEEVKPGLFIQTRKDRNDKVIYREITPMAWNGKINWKNTILGKNFIKNFIWFAIILFLAWSYHHDNVALLNFEHEVQTHPEIVCSRIIGINNGTFYNATSLVNITLPKYQGSP